MSSLRLRWRATWPDVPDDFVGFSPESDQPIGRIIKGALAQWERRDWWQWHYQAAFPGLPWAELKRSGSEDNARAAALRIEEVWFNAIAGRDGWWQDRPDV